MHKFYKKMGYFSLESTFFMLQIIVYYAKLY